MNNNNKEDQVLIGSIDQSTTSSKFTVINLDGQIIAASLKEHKQITEQSGWLEHNPFEILENCNLAIEDVLKQLDQLNYSTKQIKCIGITNQRETIVAWNKQTGKPFHNAIVWCDNRTREICNSIQKKYGSKNYFKNKNGLPIATYFSAFKIKWLIDNVSEIKQNLELNNVYFGTIDVWLIYNLTKNFYTDISNASRTFLMNLEQNKWDPDLLAEFGIPESSLPQIKASCYDYGIIQDGPLQGIEITACLGDQHAASLGHGAFNTGDVKHTYGTGCFLMMNIGDKPVINSDSNLLSTILYKLGEDKPTLYALEGAIETGAQTINWLKNNLGLYNDFDEMTKMVSELNDNGGVYFVPAFSGLFTPYWREDACGTMCGITLHTNKAHIIRSVLEAICYRTRDVIEAMQNESQIQIEDLKVDGGVTQNEWLMQFQSNILQKQLTRTKIKDSTSLGVAFAAALHKGYYNSIDELKDKIKSEKSFKFDQNFENLAESQYKRWLLAVEKSFGWN